MDITRFLVEPEWPTSWMIKIVAERILAEASEAEEANQIFEVALDKLIPPDPMIYRRIRGQKK
jgi:hypothetical protein